MKKLKLKIINSEKEHKRALATIEQLWESKPGTEEHDALEVLALLVEDYEKRTFPMDEDLVPILGSRSRVSEVLSRKRRLSLVMIRRLHDELHIPFEALIPYQ